MNGRMTMTRRATRTTTSAAAINKHFDRIAERINAMRLPARLLIDNENERKAWLAELEKHGAVSYTATGEQWTIKGERA